MKNYYRFCIWGEYSCYSVRGIFRVGEVGVWWWGLVLFVYGGVDVIWRGEVGNKDYLLEVRIEGNGNKKVVWVSWSKFNFVI